MTTQDRAALRDALKPFIELAESEAALVSRKFYGDMNHAPVEMRNYQFRSNSTLDVEQWLKLAAALPALVALLDAETGTGEALDLAIEAVTELHNRHRPSFQVTVQQCAATLCRKLTTLVRERSGIGGPPINWEHAKAQVVLGAESGTEPAQEPKP